jgi:hypothetical protein
VVDLKTAIRYVRYNKKLIPWDKDKIYTFGMSGGGAQSCLIFLNLYLLIYIFNSER